MKYGFCMGDVGMFVCFVKEKSKVRYGMRKVLKYFINPNYGFLCLKSNLWFFMFFVSKYKSHTRGDRLKKKLFYKKMFVLSGNTFSKI